MTSGTKMVLIIRRKTLEMTFRDCDSAGKAQPMKTPRAMDIRIQCVRLMRRNHDILRPHLKRAREGLSSFNADKP